MTDEQITALAIAAGIAVVGILASLIAIVIRRRRERRSRATLAATQPVPADPPPATTASPRPAVVLGPPRRVTLAPGQALPAPVPRAIPRGLPLVIPRREDPLWQEKGWRRNGRGYEGFFRAGRYRWRGMINEPYPGSFDAYIWNPPLAELGNRTSHRPCFSLAGADGRFKIHFHTMPANIDHAVGSVEAVLAQAMGVHYVH